VGLVKEEEPSTSSFGTTEEEVAVKERVSGHSFINDVKFSSDATRIVSASDDGTFGLWDVATFKKLRQVTVGDKVKVKAAQFSPSGNVIATASDDGIVALWDTRTREQIREISTHTGPATCLAFSSDDYTVVSGGWDCQIHITDSRSDNQEILMGPEDWIQSVAISPDRKHVVSSGWDTVIRQWQISPTQEKAPFLGHTKMVSSLSFSYDNRLVASSSYDGCVKLWNMVTGKLEKTLAGHLGKANAVAFASKQDGFVLSAGSDHRVILWDISSGNLRNEFMCQGPATAVSVQRSGRDLLMVFGDTIGNIDIARLVTNV
jgi:WD40 repeat protein